ncbi:MAG TPA: IS1595 family transposase [Planctomycetota bacterium]|nr:IS1595 family transposase [Planctomycetota bacterium]
MSRNTDDFPKTDKEFMRRFANDDQACWEYLVQLRWPDGFVCPECGAGERNFIESRGLFVCENGHQISVTADTVMHRTHLPLSDWFIAAWHVTTQTPGMSSVVLARKLGIKQESAFTMLHRLRAGMVRPERELLSGTVEVDETFVNAGRLKEVRAGRGSGQVIVVAAVEIIDKYTGRVRLKAIESASEKNLMDFIQDNVAEGSMLVTDGWSGYRNAKDYGYGHHVVMGENSKEVAKNMPHIHNVFSNLKAWLIGTHHGVSSKHMPAYLNEFVFRYNRRGNPMRSFAALLGISAASEGPEYEELYSVGEEAGWVHPNPEEEDDE